VVDPLGGSWYVEELTDSIESDAKKYFNEIDRLGGVIECIETGYLQKEISNASSDYQNRVDKKDRIIVGMTDFIKENEEIEIPILEIRKEVESEQNDRLTEIKKKRKESEVLDKLEKIKECCKNDKNLMPFIIDAVESYATLEEIVNSMKSVFGEWQEKAFF
jgi:methylmalonyl-CoA mutase N-terminal domain/subunit